MKKFIYNILLISTLVLSFYGLIKLQDHFSKDLKITSGGSSGGQYGSDWTKENNFSMGGEKKQQQFTLSDKSQNRTTIRGIVVNGKNIEDLIKNKHICRWITKKNGMAIAEIYFFDKTKNAVILKQHSLRDNLDNSNNIFKLFDKNSYKLSWTSEYYFIKNNLNNNTFNFESLRIHRLSHVLEFDYKDNARVVRGNCIINE